MMQFIKISDGLSRIIKTVICFSVVFFEAATASTQLEIRAGVVSGEIKPDSGIYAAGLTGHVIYNGLYALSPKLQLMLEERFDGVKSLYSDKDDEVAMQNYPLKEKLLPSSNIASAGLRWTGLGDAQLIIRNILYFKPLAIDPFYHDYMDTTYTSTHEFSFSDMCRKARTYANAYWSLPLGRATVTADLNLIFLNYRKRLLDYNSEFELVPVDSNMFFSTDLWSDYAFSFRMFDDVYIQCNTRMKQNFSDSRFLNLYRYQVELNGTARLPADNQLSWYGGLEQYQRASDEDMYEEYLKRSYPMATRLLFYLYMRDVFTISRGLYLKGTAFLETGNNLLKRRYEVSLRKAWRNLSYVEPGYCTSLGGLFPIQSAYVKSRVQATKSFSIDPAVKFSWEAQENYEKHVMEVSFMKMVSSLEFAYAIKRQFQILLGGYYTYFNEDVAKDFPTRYGLYCGIQSMIP
ncbi:MAG: hypothetical protein JW915_14270 [Chitinispirillaceae bacterium]|nr:hypothetical protein [Chitinispirillaceae bacterium]